MLVALLVEGGRPSSQASEPLPSWPYVAEQLGSRRTPTSVQQHWDELRVRDRSLHPTLVERLSRTSTPIWWRAHAKRHRLYYFSPLCYAMAGCAMYAVERGRAHAIAYEPVIWIAQTCLTFMSDVSTLGEDSRWHAADRIHAYLFTALRALYTAMVWTLLGAYSITQMTTFLVGLVLALACIRFSWTKGVRPRNMAAFLYWHALWHIALPLTAVLIAALDVAGYGPKMILWAIPS